MPDPIVFANPPVTIGPFTNVPAPGSPIRSDWAQQITAYVLGTRIDGGFATRAPTVVAAAGQILVVSVAAVQVPTRVFVTGVMNLASTTSPVNGITSYVAPAIAGVNQPVSPAVASPSGSHYGAVPLMWSWAVPAGQPGGYGIVYNWTAGAGGTIYAAADTIWQRYYQ